MLGQREYRKRYYNVPPRVHWELCKKYGIACAYNLYHCQPLPVEKTQKNTTIMIIITIIIIIIIIILIIIIVFCEWSKHSCAQSLLRA